MTCLKINKANYSRPYIFMTTLKLSQYIPSSKKLLRSLPNDDCK